MCKAVPYSNDHKEKETQTNKAWDRRHIHMASPVWGNKKEDRLLHGGPKYKNSVRKAHVRQSWRGNQEQRHRAAVKLEICLHIKEQYFATQKKDAGNEAVCN